jgi:RNA polymerase sigma factor (sigma-70 family)
MKARPLTQWKPPRMKHWILSHRGNDASSFTPIYELYAERVYAYLLERTSSREEAARGFQRCFLRFQQSQVKYDDRWALELWLYAIARAALLDLGGQVSREKETSFDEVLTSELSADREPRALEDLEIWDDVSPEQRQAIEARITDELAYEEICRRLGISQILDERDYQDFKDARSVAPPAGLAAAIFEK